MPEIDLPLVTIGIPCLNEEHYIEKCVRDALNQDYPPSRVEVVVADGGSSDRTREILEELSAREPRLRWVDNPQRIQAAAMNEIIRIAEGDVLVAGTVREVDQEWNAWLRRYDGDGNEIWTLAHDEATRAGRIDLAWAPLSLLMCCVGDER